MFISFQQYLWKSNALHLEIMVYVLIIYILVWRISLMDNFRFFYIANVDFKKTMFVIFWP